MDQGPNCDLCKENEAIYRCPGCSRKTCSLKCCVAHKNEFQCNGKRDRTKFISLSEFKDADVYSDYFLLEEIAKSTDTAQRQLLKDFGGTLNTGKNKKRKAVSSSAVEDGDQEDSVLPKHDLSQYPVSVKHFVNNARKRGVTVHLLPNGMSKRKNNSSYYDSKRDVMEWRIEWHFPSAQVPVDMSERHATETQSLRSLLEPYLVGNADNAVIMSQLLKYTEAGFEGISILMRREFVKSKTAVYYKLDIDKSIAENLQRKAVVEYPVFLVVLNENLNTYETTHDSIQEL